MYHSEVGSFAEVAARNVGAGGLTIEDSQVLSTASGNSGRVYGITVADSKFSMARTTVSGMGNASDDGAMRISGAATVAEVRDSTFTGNVGTTLTIDSDATATILQNDFHGNNLAMSIGGDNVLIEKNLIYNNNAWYSTRGGMVIAGGSPRIIGNILRNNGSDSGGAISIGSGSPLLVNNVIVGNHASYRCSAIYISAYSDPIFKHNTIADNDGGNGSAICMFGEGTHGRFYNTIIANEAIGVETSFDTGAVEMNNTLWDNVPIRIDGGGSLINNMPVYGQALFDQDEYHLTRPSAALGKGVMVGVVGDIEGEARPLPQGTLPDLGADEFAGDQVPSFWIEFYTEDPKLEATSSGGVRIEQDYYIFWNYGSEEEDPDDLPITITNDLGEGLAYDAQEISGSGDFSFQRTGQTLTWQTQQDVKKDQYGFIRYSISYEASVQAGDAIDNTVHVIAGPNALDQTITTVIPHFTPKITWPIDGESCSSQFVNMTVSGYAIPGSLIKLYEDGVDKAFGGANEEDGLFTITYDSEQAGIDHYTQITVKSCSVLNSYDCSKASEPVTITKQTSFWCPKRSWWEGDYQTVHGGEVNHHLRFGFRDNTGKLATENWSFFAGTGLTNSTLSLHLCICLGGMDYPTETWAIVKGERYNPSAVRSISQRSQSPPLTAQWNFTECAAVSKS